MENTPMIEAKNLMKYFDTPRGKLHAVDDVSFKIAKGTTMGVVGESGCGKSTLGRTMIHLLESTGGQIFFNGEDITKVDIHSVKPRETSREWITSTRTTSALFECSMTKLVISATFLVIIKNIVCFLHFLKFRFVTSFFIVWMIFLS